LNARTGCSAIAFGATPVWPWSKSKKTIAGIEARRQNLTPARAFAIGARRAGTALLVEEGEGASANLCKKTLTKHEVKVAICFGAHEDDRRSDPEDAAFERKPRQR
jgi:hypothetical protein